MIHKIDIRSRYARTLWPALLSATLLAGQATAQTTATTAPSTKPVVTTPVPYKSAFEGYQAYSDDKMTNWKTANDEVARIGGWREYAKQAQQPENTPTKTGAVNPKATP